MATPTRSISPTRNVTNLTSKDPPVNRSLRAVAEPTPPPGSSRRAISYLRERARSHLRVTATERLTRLGLTSLSKVGTPRRPDGGESDRRSSVENVAHLMNSARV